MKNDPGFQYRLLMKPQNMKLWKRHQLPWEPRKMRPWKRHQKSVAMGAMKNEAIETLSTFPQQPYRGVKATQFLTLRRS